MGRATSSRTPPPPLFPPWRRPFREGRPPRRRAPAQARGSLATEARAGRGACPREGAGRACAATHFRLVRERVPWCGRAALPAGSAGCARRLAAAAAAMEQAEAHNGSGSADAPSAGSPGARPPASPEGMALAYGSLVLMALLPIFFGALRSVSCAKGKVRPAGGLVRARGRGGALCRRAGVSRAPTPGDSWVWAGCLSVSARGGGAPFAAPAAPLRRSAFPASSCRAAFAQGLPPRPPPRVPRRLPSPELRFGLPPEVPPPTALWGASCSSRASLAGCGMCSLHVLLYPGGTEGGGSAASHPPGPLLIGAPNSLEETGGVNQGSGFGPLSTFFAAALQDLREGSEQGRL